MRTKTRTGYRIDAASARQTDQKMGHLNRNVSRGIKQAAEKRQRRADRLRSKAMALKEGGFPAVAEKKRERAKRLREEARQLHGKLM